MKKVNILVITLAVLFTFAAMGLAQEAKTDASPAVSAPAVTVAPVSGQQQTKETGKKVHKQAVKKHNKIKKTKEKKVEDTKK